ncbi:MAG: pyridoxal 5'-phosphate synthase glutaminase subunit PdxT [Gammaproteobacteria bacterium]
MRIGVLALQGDFTLHGKALARCGVEAVEVRKPEQLAGVDGLVIPGGESTTLLKLMDEWRFVPALRQFHAAGKPLFGTCAGLILLARGVDNPRQFSLGLIDVDVERNAYGRQRESFEARGPAVLGGTPTTIDMMFIRAPRIRRVGPGVDVLARQGEEPVMARQGTVLVTTFHPEVVGEPIVHSYFREMVRCSTATRIRERV